jgi:hypothetical protein
MKADAGHFDVFQGARRIPHTARPVVELPHVNPDAVGH